LITRGSFVILFSISFHRDLNLTIQNREYVYSRFNKFSFAIFTRQYNLALCPVIVPSQPKPLWLQNCPYLYR
jgi:hypothetical protein